MPLCPHMYKYLSGAQYDFLGGYQNTNFLKKVRILM